MIWQQHCQEGSGGYGESETLLGQQGDAVISRGGKCNCGLHEQKHDL